MNYMFAHIWAWDARKLLWYSVEFIHRSRREATCGFDHPDGGRSTVTYHQISYVNLIDPRADGPSICYNAFWERRPTINCRFAFDLLCILPSKKPTSVLWQLTIYQ